MSSNQEYVCCICGKKFAGWGNDPWPVVLTEDAVCCDDCNAAHIVPARLDMMLNKERKK